MNIREYLKVHKILADGAMGTYYAHKEKNDGAISEYANIENPDMINTINPPEDSLETVRLVNAEEDSADNFGKIIER